MITEETKKAFNLTEEDCKKVTRLMRNGKSLGESLVAIGKATKKVVDCNEEKVAKKTTKREVKVDPVKDWLIGYVTTALNGCVNNESISQDVTCVLRDGTKKIDIAINGESYSLTLTKHKKKA